MSQSDSEEELNEIHNNYINELIEHIKKCNNVIPSQNCRDRFSDNVLIGSFLCYIRGNNSSRLNQEQKDKLNKFNERILHWR